METATFPYQTLYLATVSPSPLLAGTGNTVTLVECALQLLQAHPRARLLLCAPQARLAWGSRRGDVWRLHA